MVLNFMRKTIYQSEKIVWDYDRFKEIMGGIGGARLIHAKTWNGRAFQTWYFDAYRCHINYTLEPMGKSGLLLTIEAEGENENKRKRIEKIVHKELRRR